MRHNRHLYRLMQLPQATGKNIGPLRPVLHAVVQTFEVPPRVQLKVLYRKVNLLVVIYDSVNGFFVGHPLLGVVIIISSVVGIVPQVSDGDVAGNVVDVEGPVVASQYFSPKVNLSDQNTSVFQSNSFTIMRIFGSIPSNKRAVRH